MTPSSQPSPIMGEGGAEGAKGKGEKEKTKKSSQVS